MDLPGHVVEGEPQHPAGTGPVDPAGDLAQQVRRPRRVRELADQRGIGVGSHDVLEVDGRHPGVVGEGPVGVARQAVQGGGVGMPLEQQRRVLVGRDVGRGDPLGLQPEPGERGDLLGHGGADRGRDGSGRFGASVAAPLEHVCEGHSLSVPRRAGAHNGPHYIPS